MRAVFAIHPCRISISRLAVKSFLRKVVKVRKTDPTCAPPTWRTNKIVCVNLFKTGS